MSLVSLFRLLMVLSDTALHQKLSSSEVPTFYLSLLQPSFQFFALWDTSKDKDVKDRLPLIFALVHTEPSHSPLQLVSQPGFDICASHHLPIIWLLWQTHAAWGAACGSPCFLLGQVGSAKHTSFKMCQDLLTEKPALGHQCAHCGWPCYFGEVRVCVAGTSGSHRAVQCGFFLHWINFVKHIHIDTTVHCALVQRMESSSSG